MEYKKNQFNNEFKLIKFKYEIIYAKGYCIFPLC